ncbi:hypothetical protein WMF38_20930 [Sorangium sp. So ce118]
MALSSHRALDDGWFSEEDLWLIELAQQVCAHALSAPPTQERLSRRAQQTLDGLMLGRSEKEIAVDLGLSEALVGDLVASGPMLGGLARLGHAIRPPFELDPRAVGVELERLVEEGVETFYLGHGGPLGADEVRRHARVLAGSVAGVPPMQRMLACPCGGRRRLVADISGREVIVVDAVELDLAEIWTR